MNVFVTGGTGFVGSHLIELLRSAGDRVRALVRPGGDRALLERLGAEPFVADLDDPATLAGACDGCDAVIHAAARVDLVGRQDDFDRTTVGGTKSLTVAARAAGVRRFVYVGTCGIHHPDTFAAGVIDEETPLREPPSWSRYGRAKLAAECAVRDEIRPPAEWVIIRLAFVYGPRNRAMRQYLHPVLANGWFRIIGDGENEMAMIHVRDAARAIEAAARTPAAAGRVLIASNPERVTQRQYFEALADGFGLPRPTGRISYSAAFAAAWMAERLHFSVFGGMLQRAGVALTGLPQRIDCTRTQKLLNWTPRIGLSEGLRDTFDWYFRECAPDAADPRPVRQSPAGQP